MLDRANGKLKSSKAANNFKPNLLSAQKLTSICKRLCKTLAKFTDSNFFVKIEIYLKR
jgi:hypothetical protein